MEKYSLSLMLILKPTSLNTLTQTLNTASKGKYIEVVKYLIERGADINIKDIWGNTALMIA